MDDVVARRRFGFRSYWTMAGDPGLPAGASLRVGPCGDEPVRRRSRRRIPSVVDGAGERATDGAGGRDRRAPGVEPSSSTRTAGSGDELPD
jgi:hypothetical protein